MEQIATINHTRVAAGVSAALMETDSRISPDTAKCVLVIDDSPTVRAVVELALRGEGYKTVSFPDGIAAMQWLSLPESFVPDLIFIDIGLPKLDGYQVIQMFKRNSRFARTVLIMLSGRDGTVDRLKGRVAGAQMYLTKPFTVQELCKAAHTCLASGGSRS
jgi:twitching motility two-component system response regulator PilG